MVDHNYSSVATEMTLSAGIDGSAGTMSLSGASGLPSQTPYTLVVEPDTESEEIVTVNSRSGDSFTISRAQEGTPAVNHSTGAKVRHKMTGRDLRWSRQHEESSSGVHGLTSGNVVGTSQSQTLTNKSIDGGSNTLTNIPQSGVTDLPANETLTNRLHTPLGYRIMTKTAGLYAGGGDPVRITFWEDALLSPGASSGILYGVNEEGELSIEDAGNGIYSVHAQVTGNVASGNEGIVFVYIYRSVTSGSPIILARGRRQKWGAGTFDISCEANVPAVELDVGQYVYVEVAHTFGGNLDLGAAPDASIRFQLNLLRPLP